MSIRVNIVAVADDHLRIPDDLWLALRSVFPDNNDAYGHRHEATRRRYMDAFFFCVRNQQPYCLLPDSFGIKKDALSSFIRLWKERIGLHLESQPAAILAQVASYTNMNPQSWLTAITTTASDMRYWARSVSGAVGRSYLNQETAIPPPVQKRALPRPLRCPRCGAKGPNLYRALEDDAWQCMLCSWIGFDPFE